MDLELTDLAKEALPGDLLGILDGYLDRKLTVEQKATLWLN